jgi:hypothetical protein
MLGKAIQGFVIKILRAQQVKKRIVVGGVNAL